MQRQCGHGIAEFMRHARRQTSEHGEMLCLVGVALGVRQLVPTAIMLHEDANFGA